MKRVLLSLAFSSLLLTVGAQTYQVPVSEEHEQMQTGKYQPTWQSLKTHQTP